MRDNPAHLYREVAKKIVAQVKRQILDTLEMGRGPDMYWKLEQAIVDAMRAADGIGAERATAQMTEILKDFEADDGTSTS